MYLNLSNSILNYKCVFFMIQDMSQVDVVKNHFEVSDSNHDGQLDSREWLGYMRENLHSLKRDKKSRILRQEFFFYKETSYRHSLFMSSEMIFWDIILGWLPGSLHILVTSFFVFWLFRTRTTTQCARTDLNKRFFHKPMTTTGWKYTP